MDQDPIYSKREKPLDPIVRSKINRVSGEHLMQAVGISRRQLKLLDIGDTVANIAEQDGKLNTRAIKQKEREKKVKMQVQIRVVGYRQKIKKKAQHSSYKL